MLFSLKRLAATITRPTQRVRLWIVLGNGLVALVLCIATTLNLRATRATDLARASDAADNLASSLSVELAAELHLADNALVTIARRLQDEDLAGLDLASPRVQALLQEQQTLIPFVAAVRIANRRGAVMLDSSASAPVSIADRDYFHRALQAEAAVLSEPLVSRIFGGWCVILARRVVDRHGQAQGVVYAVLASEHFSSLFSRLALDSRGAISLRNDRLQLIARHSAADPARLQDLGSSQVSPELRALVERQVDAGRFVTATALDGIERVNALRRVPGYPLVLVAGLGSEAYIAPWNGHALRHWGFTLAVLLLVAGGSVYVDLQHRRLRRALARASELAAQQEKMLNNDLVGMVKLKDRRVIWSNRASERLFGYSHREMEGLPTRQLYASTADFETFGQRAYEALRRGETYRGQIQLVRRDGVLIWVDVSGVSLSPESGEDLWMSLDISAMKRQHERVEHAAFHDALTGLPNRLLLMDRLRQAVQRCQRSQELLAVCFLDLDGFKHVNDSLGHAAGDELLQEIARRLHLELRAHDTVARVGGDEFVVLLPNLHSLAEAEEVAERLVLAVARPVALRTGRVVQVGTSMGIACWPFDGQDEDSLLAAADRAMYADKAARRAVTP